MNKWLKIAGIGIAVLVVLVIALVVLAKVLITPERVKQTVVPMAEQALDRRIELGEVEVSLFSGIELQQLKVYDKADEEIFIGTDRVRLKYQLLPLLAMKVVVDEVLLEQPRIRIVRLEDGRFNFSDLIEADDGQPTQAVPEPVSDDDGPPLNLLISQVRLQGGHLLFLDHQLNSEAPYRYEISDLEAAAEGITLTGTVPVNISCQLNGGRLSVDGKVDLQRREADLAVKLQELDIIAFKPYFADQLPGQLDSLRMNLDASIEGGVDQLAAKGGLQISDLDLTLAAMPDAPLENARLAVDFDVAADLAQEQVTLANLQVDFNQLVAQASGQVSDYASAPVADLELQVPGIELRQALASLPKALVQDVINLDPAGTVKLRAKLQGAVAKPQELLQSALLTLEHVQATTGGLRPSLTGELAVDGDELNSRDLVLRLGDNRADIVLSARNLFGQPIVATADLTSQRFLLDPLLKGSAGAAAAGAETPPAEPTAQGEEELGPFDLPVQASGRIKIDETVYQGLVIKDFAARYRLKDNIFSLEEMGGQVAGGSFASTATVDLGVPGLKYQSAVKVNTIQADPLLTAFLPKAAGVLFGAMNLDMAIQGRGTRWQTLREQLSAQGDMQVNDGRLADLGLVQGLAAFLNVSDLKQIQFQQFKGTFKIVDGRLQLDGSLLGDRLKLYPKGQVGLNGSLDLAVDTRLSPELAGRVDQKGEISRFLADQEGWSQLPLLVSGNLASPRFGLDPSGVKKQATKAIGQKVEQQIDKLFKQKQPADSQAPAEGQSTEKPAEEPAQKMLKDSLKNLFGN